jgi:hypothetical protein
MEYQIHTRSVRACVFVCVCDWVGLWIEFFLITIACTYCYKYFEDVIWTQWLSFLVSRIYSVPHCKGRSFFITVWMTDISKGGRVVFINEIVILSEGFLWLTHANFRSLVYTALGLLRICFLVHDCLVFRCGGAWNGGNCARRNCTTCRPVFTQ